MKVLVLTNAPVPYRMDFFEELGKKCALTVLFEQTAEEQTHRNQKWFAVKGHSFETVYLKGIRCGAKKIQFEALKYYRPKGYDLIMVMGYSLPTEMLSIMYLSIKRIPFILCFDGVVPKHTSALKTAIKKYLIPKASGYLSTGKYTDNYIQEMGGKEENIFRVPFTTLHEQDIPESIPGKELKDQLKAKLHLSGENIVLSVGQFIYRKGFDILIKAASGMKGTHSFYIVGDEPTEEYIDLKNRLKAKNVHFIGFKNKKELSEYYSAADYFILPTREDVWALVIPEAMSYGLPTITTDHCGAGLELIRPRFPKCIIPIDDSDAIVNALQMLDKDHVFRENVRKANYEMMRSYTVEQMVDTYMQIFDKFNGEHND